MLQLLAVELIVTVILIILLTIFLFFSSKQIIGHSLDIIKNKDRRVEWTSHLLHASPSATVVVRFLGRHRLFTANPSTVEHILKTKFNNYQKGESGRAILFDLLGDGIFNADGASWKFQRQVSSHEFNTRSLRHFVEHVVDTELSDRLIPILSLAAAKGDVLDLQDILQRFAFDNVCRIAFGHDPEYLQPSLPDAEFATAFEDATTISTYRFISIFPLVWKVKRALNIGSEKRLKEAVGVIRDFSKRIVKEKKDELEKKSSLDSVDLLSRFLSSGHSDEDFVTDIVISFILAGRDTTSAALTWFFWLIAKHPEIEREIHREVMEKSVPLDTKIAVNDDVLPDGTVVKGGTRITYHPYAMGRAERIWGPDWAEFRPERWLREVDLCGEGSVQLPGFPSGAPDMLGEGDGVLADEAGGCRDIE
ncbi:Cytochrome P450 94A1 [Linum perenne]